MSARQLDLVTALDFDRFWATMPKRRGANPKHPARLKFETAIRSGASAEHIISAAARYAAEQASLKHVGTEYVAMASTWLHQRRYEDYPAAPVSAPAAYIWILRDSPQWETFAAAYRASKGKPAPTVAGLGGMGWNFPTPLMGTGRPETPNPSEQAAGKGSILSRRGSSADKNTPHLDCFGTESNRPGSPAADWQETDAGSGAPIPSRAAMPATPER